MYVSDLALPAEGLGSGGKIPLTMSLTHVRSAKISRVYSGVRRSSMAIQ